MTGLTSVQANFVVIIEAQQKRTSRETTLFQLCAYYLAFLDFAVRSFQRGHRLLKAFPNLPRGKSENSNMGLENSKTQSSSQSIVDISEKEVVDLISDVTTIKLFRNTVKVGRRNLNQLKDKSYFTD